MADELQQRIRSHRDRGEADPEIAARLLWSVALILRRFDGAHRDRLLALAGETLERHLEIRAAGSHARAALASLRRNRQRLVELLDFLEEPAPQRHLH